MAITRRRLILAASTIPALLIAQRAARSAGDIIAGAVSAARPSADGTSATRCAQCGSPDHTMLDPQCPMAPRVIA